MEKSNHNLTNPTDRSSTFHCGGDDEGDDDDEDDEGDEEADEDDDDDEDDATLVSFMASPI